MNKISSNKEYDNNMNYKRDNRFTNDDSTFSTKVFSDKRNRFTDDYVPSQNNLNKDSFKRYSFMF
jgi:hypothetical protein